MQLDVHHVVGEVEDNNMWMRSFEGVGSRGAQVGRQFMIPEGGESAFARTPSPRERRERRTAHHFSSCKCKSGTGACLTCKLMLGLSE